MYNMNDYRTALNERDSHDMGSSAWDLSQQKATSIVGAMIASGDEQMVREVVDEVYSLNECGLSISDTAVQINLWLLESNGHREEAEELRELDWE